MNNFLDKFETYKLKLRTLSDNKEKVDLLNTYAWESRRFDTKSAFILAQQAQSLSQQLWYQKGFADSLKIIGTCNWYFADYLTSLEKCLEALKIYQEIEDIKGESDSTNTISYVYASLGDYENALKYSKHNLKLKHEMADKAGEASALVTIGVNNMRMGNHQNALKYLLDAFAIEEADRETKAFILAYKGEVYFHLGDYENSLKQLKLALTEVESIISKNMIAHCLNFLGKIYTHQNRPDKAIPFLEKGLMYSIEIDSKQEIYEIHKTLSFAYEQKGDITKAFEHFKLYHVIKEEVFNAENAQKIKTIQFQIQTQNIQKESEMERQKNVELIKAYDEIAMIQKEISEKNKSITDSINYAKKIQQAMLPHRSSILASFPHSFVLYKPKDIVSGDFYWFNQQDDTLLIAVADCTGHGVPGAFTSLICSEKLHDAAKHNHIPGEILSIVNKDVKISLRQEETKDSTKDGMDIALCLVDLKNNLVQFAGANRPIWIVRKDSNHIEEIKGTKSSIGGYTEDESLFETHTIEFNEGDTFYISSDGYADQDGGENHKKLMTKTFKELILSIQDKPLKQQGKFLEEYITNWRGEVQQLDDILVIGIKH
ncbi:MAG: tetratricopeptide repeat protein [Bacteroidota bacterium]